MKPLTILVLVSLCLSMVSCKKKAPAMEPLGASAPEFGKEGKTDIPSFLAGRWCMVMPNVGIKPGRYYEFKADGTFEAGVVGGDWTSTGKWISKGDQVQLSYMTMKGMPFETYRQQYKKDEEGGGQAAVARALYYDDLFAELGNLGTLWLDDDKKHLTFSAPRPTSAGPGFELGQGEGGQLGDLLKHSGPALERMGAKKEDS